eukprot:CAMPEP_0202447966 /NCGR_PEP_ID=MMETSP1360-20130828/6744_1 /ASSEMBLY_ACC=CAM_ASM_000848 /TAXON_ID=515479 /ORGANISM="Licmophora paradoxa, Strain CCMP2313" /LENGTH=252 /DNA_ID=CAMNT_0049065301 /DNA_START=23 /DNA_END=781 /DNA_ORIENTATION=-
MKTFIYLFSLLVVADAGVAPEVTVGVSSTDGLEPALKWTTSGTQGDFDYEGGLDVIVEGTKSMPYTAWGRLKRSIGDYNIGAKGVVKSTDLETVDLELTADGPIGALQVVGKAGQTNGVAKIQIKRAFSLFGGSLSLNPRFSVADKSPDVSVGYGIKSTFVGVDTSSEKLTIAQKIGEQNSVSPSVTKNGDFAIAYSRSMNVGKLTTTYAPKNSVKVEWRDGPWIANMEAPLDGYLNVGKVDVSFKRKVDLK